MSNKYGCYTKYGVQSSYKRPNLEFAMNSDAPPAPVFRPRYKVNMRVAIDLSQAKTASLTSLNTDMVSYN